jgi:transcriptional regulator with GAF, ATPase, and Fis domain
MPILDTKPDLQSTSPVIAQSKEMLTLLEAVQLVAMTDATVLISGETGTGKELIARAVHDSSPRRKKRMVTVNCAALPRDLVESELFGHERGAFTGANERRAGRFELADGGSIFLDEIGELPHEAQAKLLRVIQERSIERVGGNNSINVDVRIIAATNRNLPRMVMNGEFRADLFYRLNVYPLAVPPLRERGDDIDLLAEHFLKLHASKSGKRLNQISSDTLQQLRKYCWPGNVRELENVIERLVIMAPAAAESCELAEGFFGMSALSPDSGTESVPDLDRSLDEVVRLHIARVLRYCGGTIEGKNGAAAILGLKPSTLRFRIRQLGVDRIPSEKA